MFLSKQQKEIHGSEDFHLSRQARQQSKTTFTRIVQTCVDFKETFLPANRRYKVFIIFLGVHCMSVGTPWRTFKT